MPKHKTIPIFVPHWGCPKDCLFCNQKSITGVKEPMTAERAAAIIRKGVDCKKPGDFLEIGFFGGSFTGIPAGEQEALLAEAQKAVEQGKVDGIRLSTRPDYINETVLKRLARFGVTCIELGAQSMDDEVLALNHRGHRAEDTVKAAHLIRQKGFSLGLQMMVGLYGGSFGETMETAQKIAELAPDCVRIYPALVLRNTGLCELYEQGTYLPLSLREAVETCAWLYRFFAERDIFVIRMGLLEVEKESLVTGPYHPAFGEMVLSEVCYLDLMKKMDAFRGESVVVSANPKDVSVVLGQNREDERKFVKNYGLTGFCIRQDESLPRGTYGVTKQAK